MILVVAGFCFIVSLAGREILTQIVSIGPKGIQFQARHALEQSYSIQEMPLPPTPITNFAGGGDAGFEVPGLTPEQQWVYRRGSSLFFYLDHAGVDPAGLEGPSLRRYRKLVLWIAGAALNEGEDYQALQFMKRIEGLPDLTLEEKLNLARAYWVVGQAEEDIAKGRESLSNARRLFKEYLHIDRGDALCHYALGWIEDELGHTAEAIREMRKAIGLDDRYTSAGYWTIAVSRTKRQEFDKAIEALKKVPTGADWIDLCADPELDPLRASTQGAEFRTLCGLRRPASAS